MAVQINRVPRTVPTGPMPLARVETIREAIEAINREPYDKATGRRLECMYAALSEAERAAGRPW